MAKKKPHDRILGDLLESARDLNDLGILDKHGFVQIEALCLEKPPAYSPHQVMLIRRQKAKMSQAVFAKVLNVSLSTVQKWEAPGAGKAPNGASAKLLQIIEKKGVEALMVPR